MSRPSAYTAHAQARQDFTRPASKTVVKRPKKSMQELFSALDNDSASAAGYLKKKSTNGDWQMRYFEVRGEFLMYWRDEAHSRKHTSSFIGLLLGGGGGGGGGAGGGGGGQTGVASPDCAYDLRKMASAVIVDFVGFEGGSSSLVVEEQALQLTSRSGRVVVLRAATKRDRKNLSRWQARIDAQVLRADSPADLAAAEEAEEEAAAAAVADEEYDFGDDEGLAAAKAEPDDVAVVLNDEDEDDGNGTADDDGGGGGEGEGGAGLRDSVFAPMAGEVEAEEQGELGGGGGGGVGGTLVKGADAAAELDIDGFNNAALDAVSYRWLSLGDCCCGSPRGKDECFECGGLRGPAASLRNARKKRDAARKQASVR